MKRTSNKRKIVHKIEEGTDPSEVYCTTYQMRNFFAQMKDGFFSSLDVMNYIQHHSAVLRMKKGHRVLDVCCGRGLILPLLRYYRSDIKEYVGIDISERNIKEQLRRSGVKPIDSPKEYYPFKLTHVIGSVEDMDKFFKPNSFDFILYTSSIEHMQPKAGYRSLKHCYDILKPGQEMFLSCPNTSDKQNPYDTQYAAHVYEWGINELKEAVQKVGFEIEKEYGLVAKTREFEKWLESQDDSIRDQYFKLKEYLPNQWLMSFFPILYPEASSEILLILRKPTKTDKQRLF